jgi:two-component system, OmpR family, sensor histidine kinase BaeS
VAAVVALGSVAGTVLVWSIAGTVGGPHPGRPFPPGALFLLLPIAIALFALLGGARSVGRPVGALVEAARRIEAGDYSTRVPEHGPHEVRSVARAFNSMSARLEADKARRQSFLADVAHELRTPLAVIRGQAEAIADGVYPADEAHLAPILDATRTLGLLVEDLRTLALSDAGSLFLNREEVDLRMLVEDAVAGAATQAAAAGVDLRADVEEGLGAIEADPARLRGVLANLLSNALRHTPAGGSIGVTAAREGSEALLSVEDSGEGIPPDLLPRVFDRFVRGAGSTGSGLGLAIARDVVEAHGGRIAVESRPASGTRVRVWLPLGQA